MDDNKNFVPAAGVGWLTPVYDMGVRLLTRERVWRQELLDRVDLKPNENILDVGCGTGSFALLLKQRQPDANIIAIDPDPDVLSIARSKVKSTGNTLEFIEGFFEASMFSPNLKFDKIVSSLVLHQVPMKEKQRILALAYEMLVSGGTLHIADYGWQRTRFMRQLFRIIQRLDGFDITEPNAQGVLPEYMKEVGFVEVQEVSVIPTPTGSISIYFAKKA